MKDSKTLYWSSKFSWARERISWKFIHNLGTHPQQGSPALVYTVLSRCWEKNPFLDGFEQWSPSPTSHFTDTALLTP